MSLDETATRRYVQRTWEESVIPALTEYVRIPAKSPMFDPAWKEHGHLDRAVALLQGWSERRPVEGLRLEVVRLEGRTP
ncbi:MAG: peptidase M20, partial [Candidatus Rokuibacteriota bacterium]